ncbi:MAG: hypothetical protein FJ301_11405 [Planctomycetes bacterium]|nr:hypothetical protein [Planctomycetota bacterium]
MLRRSLAAFALAFAAVVASAPLLRAQDEGAGFEECTVGVAAGSATADGRPLLWKNRDAQKQDNVVLAFDDGKSPYLGLCDAGNRDVVWGGANAAGFGIINSVSRDLPGGSTKGPGNGGFMKRALKECVTVDDFEQLLQATNDNGRRTKANFGVIDATGGAAFFEAAHTTYTRFDAKDARDGLVLRTNHATTAAGDRGKDRLARATALCKQPPKGGLTPAFVLGELLRDLQPPPSARQGEQGRQDVRETIHRQTTVAALVLHGVKPGEDGAWTTMWTVLGQPLFAPAVPLWPAARGVPKLVEGAPKSELCSAARALADAFYAAEGGGDGADAGGAGGQGGEGEGGEAEVAGAIRWLRTEGLQPVREGVRAEEKAAMQRWSEGMAMWKLKRGGAKPDAAELRRHQEMAAERALAALRRVGKAAGLVEVGAGAGR